MLNIKEAQSTNVVEISGILSQIEVEAKQTADGKNYASAKLTVKVDQEIGGKMVENEIPVKMFSMEYKSGTQEISKIYTGILKLKELVSLASLPDDEKDKASKIIINKGNIKENIWVDPSSGQVRTSFEIDTNFVNTPRGNTEFEPEAKFELSGVVMDMTRETDANQEETGRLKVKLAVVGWTNKKTGVTRVDVIDLIAASENAVNFIESNWEKGDTVNLNGAISFNQSTKVWYEEQGFGEPIKRTKTMTRKELIILGGSPSGLEEEYSYDANDIKAGLADRAARVEEQKEKGGKPKTQKKTTSFDDVNPGF